MMWIVEDPPRVVGIYVKHLIAPRSGAMHIVYSKVDKWQPVDIKALLVGKWEPRTLLVEVKHYDGEIERTWLENLKGEYLIDDAGTKITI